MNSLAAKYYEVNEESNIQEVIFLNEELKSDWDALSERFPDLPRCWFELGQLSPDQRREFITSLWLDRLPFSPKSYARLSHFFEEITDISILIVRRDFEFSPEMVYSLSEERSFFRGFPPLSEVDIQTLRKEVDPYLPIDYLSFLRIHNGFGKLGEKGMIALEEIFSAQMQVQKILERGRNGIRLDSLIPFFEDDSLNSFQCFFSDWYPESSMGNVYLSGINDKMSDISDSKHLSEQLAFPTFMEWLRNYLEGMSVSH